MPVMCEKVRYYEDTSCARRQLPKVDVQVLAISGDADLPSGTPS